MQWLHHDVARRPLLAHISLPFGSYILSTPPPCSMFLGIHSHICLFCCFTFNEVGLGSFYWLSMGILEFISSLVNLNSLTPFPFCFLKLCIHWLREPRLIHSTFYWASDSIAWPRCFTQVTSKHLLIIQGNWFLKISFSSVDFCSSSLFFHCQQLSRFFSILFYISWNLLLI